MGTISLTVFKDKKDKEICVMYRQFDGYPSGHGQDLYDFLNEMKIVNGFQDPNAKLANGMGCLTAQVISHFKDEVGNFYIHPAGTRDCWEDYIYTLYVKDKKLYMTISDTDEIIFDDQINKFKSWFENYNEEN